ncbi:Hypothetical protein GLP15_4603 [Giardia lamblia P15]|uniref:Uncharacterized protein n=1 Tax=Giardia intestinalis (strain P15) TaxID=658858 RepID=E1F7P7_GIAIA|nr:Hypothetical protein GLP15_4603 [Giardia lamblia P15]
MSKPQDNTLMSSAATPQTPDASMLYVNQEKQNAITTSQIGNVGLFLSANTSMTQEISSTQALHILKLQAQSAANGATFTLLEDKEVIDKLGSMANQIQELSSTICVMSDDLFKKSTLIADLTKQLQRSERELVRLSAIQKPLEPIVTEDSHFPLITGSNLPVNIDSATLSFQSNQSDGTPPVSTVLTNEPALDSTPPLAVQLSLSNPPDDTYEPESPTYHRRSELKASLVDNICPMNDYAVELTELRALLSNQDHLINALVSIANEEAELLKVLLMDEEYLPDDVAGIQCVAAAIDTLREAGILLVRDDLDLHRSVKTKLIELQELRFSVKLLGTVKQGTDDRLLAVAQKVSTSLSKFERMFCYFVILGLYALLFSQWIVNPWKYN